MTSENSEMTAPTSIPFDDLVWRPVDPGYPDGPQIAALWGDPIQTAFGALLKVPAGCESPPHSHSHDERVIQLRGQSVHWTDDESTNTAAVMNPGDYMIMPREVDHVSATTGDEESIEFITMNGAFDFNLANTTPEEK